MTDTVIINYATGYFTRGQNRLREESLRQGYEGDFLFFNEENVLKCPPHSEVPYGFKPYAMKEAQKAGYRYLLWCDASVYPVAPVSKAFDIIKELGYLLMPGGWNTGQWCSDPALQKLGITREQAFEIPHPVAGCQGLDLDSAKSRYYLDRYFELANDGVTFYGYPKASGITFAETYHNVNGQASPDKRVKGHRHDQTAAGVIAWKLGMRDWKPNVIMYDETGAGPRKDSIIFLVRSA